jgi:hypothetical protein
MDSNPMDPVEEQAARAFADPGVQASIEEFHRQLPTGTLRSYTTQEAIERLVLDPGILSEDDEV